MGIERETAAPGPTGAGVGVRPASFVKCARDSRRRRDICSSPQRRPTPTMSVEACPESVEACPEPVEGPVLSLSKGGRSERTAPAGPGRQPDLRVNVAKCRRMSHFFIPPLGECRTLRVKNLTIWADFRPFWPISVHFRARHPRAPTREPMPSRGRTALYGENPESRPVPAIPSFSCPDTGIHAPSL